MLEVHELATSGTPTDRLVLPWELRRKSRLRATTAAGAVIGIFLPRGTRLLAGSLLRASDGQTIIVEAALEDLSTVRAADPVLLARVAYQLGNRHVRAQLGAGFVRYRHDRAVDGLLRDLGAIVTLEEAPFEPERGAMEHHDRDHDYAS
jgi:urease accessory protein